VGSCVRAHSFVWPRKGQEQEHDWTDECDASAADNNTRDGALSFVMSQVTKKKAGAGIANGWMELIDYWNPLIISRENI
jgi:hypothetical protein